MALVDGQLSPVEVPALVQELARNAALVAELQGYLADTAPGADLRRDAVSFFVGELVIHVQPLSGRLGGAAVSPLSHFAFGVLQLPCESKGPND